MNNNQKQYNMKSLVMNKDPTGFGHSYMMSSGETTPKAKNVHLQKKSLSPGALCQRPGSTWHKTWLQ